MEEKTVTRMTIVFWGLILIPSSIFAETQNHLNPYKVERIEQFIGNTIVGVTRNGSIWSAHISRDGTVEFHYASGSSTTGTWWRKANDTICFEVGGNNTRSDETCKRVWPAGQGLYWLTENQNISSSQIILISSGRFFADRASYLPDIQDWVGTIVVGRLLDSKKVWQAVFQYDGFVDFYYAAGLYRRGIYFLYQDTLCIRFIADSLTHCRRPEIIDGKIAWVNTEDDSYISEVVYLNRLNQSGSTAGSSTTTSPTSAFRQNTSQASARRGCTSEKESELRVACIATAAGEEACSHLVRQQLSSGAVSGASAAALCSTVSQKLRDGEIDPAALGLSAISGAAIGAGKRMLSENSNSIMGMLLTIGGYAGTISLIDQCIKNVERRCSY